MKKLALIIMVLVILTACTPATTPTPTQADSTTLAKPAAPTLLTDELGTAAELVPSDAEIADAKDALGTGMIGIISCTMGSEYHATLVNSAQDYAQELGIKTTVIDSQVQADQQISAIENLVSAGAKAIVICVLDPAVVKPALEAAVEAGVYIVQTSGRESAYNGIGISIEDADLGCANGELAGEAINTFLDGKGVVAILDYPDLPNIVTRADNIEKCLLQTAPNATIIGRFLGGTTENAQTSVENALQAYPDIDVIASVSDLGAYGALTALQAANKDPEKTFVIGIDAEEYALDLIKAGGMYYGTVDTNPSETGVMAIDAAIKLLAHATVEKNIKVEVLKVTESTMK
ncbi:MAG TPA: hypothetical protein DCK95_10195 [Anaerolineaceae bacterium]|nr:hypothetical protein [Anaerolineaceae bacterium]